MEALVLFGTFQAFTVAKRTLEGQDMIYQSMKLTNGIWGLMEIKLAPDNPNIILSFKSRVMEVSRELTISINIQHFNCLFFSGCPAHLPSVRCYTSQLDSVFDY